MKTRPIDKLRLTHGLHWRTTNPSLYPSPRVRTGFIRIALAVAVMGWINSHWAVEEERKETAHVKQVLVDCLNGRAKFQVEDDGKGDIIFDVCKGVQTIPVPRGGI